MLAIRSIFFALLLPGTVTVLIPYLIASSRGPIRIEYWTLWQYLSLLLIIVGTGIVIWCIRDFAVVGRGTLAPIDPPKHLVVRGPYRYVRNPMYGGVFSILLGGGAPVRLSRTLRLCRRVLRDCSPIRYVLRRAGVATPIWRILRELLPSRSPMGASPIKRHSDGAGRGEKQRGRTGMTRSVPGRLRLCSYRTLRKPGRP